MLGFGEVGQALAVDFAARGVSGLAAWDILFPVADSAPRRASTAKGVRAAASIEDAIATADLVISAVTAAQDVVAARSVVPHLKRNAYFLDVNSVSPGVKVEVSQIVEAAGGRYVESAIMSPINPKRAAFADAARRSACRGVSAASPVSSDSREQVFLGPHRQRIGREDVPQRDREGNGSAAWRVAARGTTIRCREARCSSHWAVC